MKQYQEAKARVREVSVALESDEAKGVEGAQSVNSLVVRLVPMLVAASSTDRVCMCVFVCGTQVELPDGRVCDVPDTSLCVGAQVPRVGVVVSIRFADVDDGGSPINASFVRLRPDYGWPPPR